MQSCRSVQPLSISVNTSKVTVDFWQEAQQIDGGKLKIKN